MEIEGYSVLLEKGSWVDEKLFFSPQHHEDIKEKLAHLIQHPDYPRYAQHNELKRIKRLRIADTVRVYAMLYPSAKLITILAVVGRGEVKRDEKSGALDYSFIHYLRRHAESFIPQRFSSVEEDRHPQIEIVSIPPEPEMSWEWKVETRTLGKEEALRILDASRPLKGIGAVFRLDPIALPIAREVLSKNSDRILIPLPEGFDSADKKAIQALRVKISKTLDFFGKKLAVRYDDLSQKFLIIPPEMTAIYCTRQYGRQKAIVTA